MIKPTVGRCVYYFETPQQEQPFDAHIVYVHSDTRINIAYFNHVGCLMAVEGAQLWQGEGERPTQAHCEWMPYQVGQAKQADSSAHALPQALAALEKAGKKS